MSSLADKALCIAEVLNPDMKFSWMSLHWDAQDVANAHEWMIDAVRLPNILSQMKLIKTFIRWLCIRHLSVMQDVCESSNQCQWSCALAPQQYHMCRPVHFPTLIPSMLGFITHPWNSASTPFPSWTPSSYIPTLELPSQLSPEELAVQQQCLHDQDHRDAELELNHYKAESPTLHIGEQVTDLVCYWEICVTVCISTTALAQGIDLSAWRRFFPCSFKLPWMSSLLKPLLYHVNGYSRQAN